MDFTEEQIRVLKAIADAQIAEDKDIETRNAEITAHTAKLDSANSEVTQLAERFGIDPSKVRLAPVNVETEDSEKNYLEFKKEADKLAEAQGLDNFVITKVDNESKVDNE